MLTSRRVSARIRSTTWAFRAQRAASTAAGLPSESQRHLLCRSTGNNQALTFGRSVANSMRAVAMQSADQVDYSPTIHSKDLNCTALRGGIQEGLLMVTLPVDLASAAADGTIPVLTRGHVLWHEGREWVCTFSIDQYWFAVPLLSDAAATQWRGQHQEEADRRVEAILHCLRQATPTQAQRAQLSEGVSTGISALDVLAPIGRGQSLLICGTKGSGKTTLACDVVEQLLSSSQFDRIVRFCIDPCSAPSDVPSQHEHAYAELASVRGPSESASIRATCFLGALMEAVATTEATRDAGGHAVLVLDTLAPITDAWDLGVQWVESAEGRGLDPESTAGQRRSFFSNLFERAANLLRGGSLTLLTIVDTDAFAAVGPSAAESLLANTATIINGEATVSFSLADFAGRKQSDLERIRRLEDRGIALTEKTLAAVGIAAPNRAPKTAQVKHSVVMRELQSLSDGQVVLDKGMAETGDFPSVIPGTTFSRFGLGSTEASRSTQAKPVQRDVRPTALQAVAAHLRVELALEHDTRFRPPVEGDATSRISNAMDADMAQSTRMQAVKAALLQPLRAHLQTEEMVALLLAACSGAFDALPAQQVVECLRGGSDAAFLKHLHSSAPQLVQKLKAEHISADAARELDMQTRLFVALQTAS